MFTGLIKEVGTVKNVARAEKGLTITIEAPGIIECLGIGDSVAVNGICLTVVNFGKNWFSAEATAETLRVTSLGDVRNGTKVNLEPALRLCDRLGGHLVTGHIDGAGRIVRKAKDGNMVMMEVEVPFELHKYIIAKGSIALDGISLTIAEKTARGLKVAVIPHTSSVTALLHKKEGDIVNIECDILAKYVESLLPAVHHRPQLGLLEKLKEAGF